MVAKASMEGVSLSGTKPTNRRVNKGATRKNPTGNSSDKGLSFKVKLDKEYELRDKQELIDRITADILNQIAKNNLRGNQ